MESLSVFRLLTAGALMLSLTGCGSSGGSSSSDDWSWFPSLAPSTTIVVASPSSAAGAWQTTSIRTASGVMVNPPNGFGPTINVSASTFSGSTGCSAYTAAFKLVAGRLRVNHLASAGGVCTEQTAWAPPDEQVLETQEQTFLADLAASRSMTIADETTGGLEMNLPETVMTLADQTGRPTLVLQKIDPKSETDAVTGDRTTLYAATPAGAPSGCSKAAPSPTSGPPTSSTS